MNFVDALVVELRVEVCGNTRVLRMAGDAVDVVGLATFGDKFLQNSVAETGGNAASFGFRK